MPIDKDDILAWYRKELMAHKYRSRRDFFLKLLGEKCADCDTKENLYLSPTAKANPDYKLNKRMNNAPFDELYEQALQHYIICASCRAKKRNGVEHGGGASGVRNCKCAPCKAKKAEFMKNYNAERRKKQKEN